MVTIVDVTVKTVDRGEAARVRALHELRILDTPQEERFDRVVRMARDIFGVKAAAVNLVDADRQFTKAGVGLGGAVETACEDAMCVFTVQADDELIVEDATRDGRYRDHSFATGEEGWRFYAGHPLHAPGGEPVGALCLVDDRPREMTDRDRQLLAEMAGWVESELARQVELDEAAEVQQILMPHTRPDLPGWEVAGRCVPTRDIGGDFFTWQELDDGRLQVHLADVMGKGIAAALLAASVRAMLMGAAQFNDQDGTVHRASLAAEQMLEDARAFVTVFSARLDPATGVLEFVDAGHGLAFILGQGGYRRLALSGPPMGALPGTRWTVQTTTLEPGETLVVISDGYLDFFPTLEESVDFAYRSGLHRLGAAELVERMTAYARGRGHDDDLTILAVSRDEHG
nr:SpoIIE family protein phosphatase [Micrococcus sp. TA1]